MHNLVDKKCRKTVNSNHFSLRCVSQIFENHYFSYKICRFHLQKSMLTLSIQRLNNLTHNLLDNKSRKTGKATIFRSDIYITTAFHTKITAFTFKINVKAINSMIK
ncbi:hypothetical protein ACJW31_05G209700 [Castanea mollissima]